MQEVRVYDASRHPQDWSGIIRPWQFVVFPSRVVGDAPCAFDGTPLEHHAAVCAIADSLDEAERDCRARVLQYPGVRLDVFDSAGRSHPPLLTIVHPERASELEGDAHVRQRNRRLAIALIIAAPLLMWLDWTSRGLMIVPTVVAVNGLLLAARLLQLNAAYSAAERRRQERLASLDRRPTGSDPAP